MALEIKKFNRESLLNLGAQYNCCHDLMESSATMVVSYQCYGKTSGFIGEVTAGNSFEEAEAIAMAYFSDEFYSSYDITIIITPWNGEVDYGWGPVKEAA